MLASFAPIGTLRGFTIVEESELRLELAGLKTGIDTITREVRELKVSVHGNQELNIGGVEARVKVLEDKQSHLNIKMTTLESERDSVRHWFKGATWVTGALLVLITVGGGVGLRTMLELLNQIAKGVP
jgi:hypothetical protein